MTQVSVIPVTPEPRLRLVRDEPIVQQVAKPVPLHPEGGAFVPKRPLVVDLDGTLVRSDLLIETAFSELGRRPHAVFEMVAALARGKAALKHRLAEPVDFDPSVLPYDEAVLARIRRARDEGRPVYLASASHRRLVGAVAEHLGLFNGWFASDEHINLAGAAKAKRLVESFGQRGFDYIGNDAADLPVWAEASNCLAVRTSSKVAGRLKVITPDAEHIPHEKAGWRTWAKLIRVHQWAKNGLVFLPLLAGHVFELEAVLTAALAFIAFSLCASGVYVLNDLVDLGDDRRHHSKCNRPLACGAIPLHDGVIAVPLLFAAAFGVAAAVSWAFVGMLLAYFALTTAYSFYLKRKMLVDVVTLAGLYTIRVIAGAVAISIDVSPWLLAFCMAIFVSLALLKRYVELVARADANKPDSTSRDYKASDAPMVAALAAAAGFNAVFVFAMYISSDVVLRSYSSPELLWLVCPVLLYWIARAMMLAQRRAMPDDPVVFAIKDRVSLMSLAAVGCLMLVAI